MFRLYYVLKQYYAYTGKFRYYTVQIRNPATGEMVTEAEERLISPGKLKGMLKAENFSCVHLSRGAGWLIPKYSVAKMLGIYPKEILDVFQKPENVISFIPIANLFFRSFLLVGKK